MRPVNPLKPVVVAFPRPAPHSAGQCARPVTAESAGNRPLPPLPEMQWPPGAIEPGGHNQTGSETGRLITRGTTC